VHHGDGHSRDVQFHASNRSTSGVRMRALIAVMVGAGLDA
jgi:hypothetical protein